MKSALPMRSSCLTYGEVHQRRQCRQRRDAFDAIAVQGEARQTGETRQGFSVDVDEAVKAHIEMNKVRLMQFMKKPLINNSPRCLGIDL